MGFVYLIETFPNSEGVVREVRLKTANTDSVHRVVHQLILLISIGDSSKEEKSSAANDPSENPACRP